MACQGEAWNDTLWLGMTGQGRAGKVSGGQCRTEQDREGQGEEGQCKTMKYRTEIMAKGRKEVTTGDRALQKIWQGTGQKITKVTGKFLERMTAFLCRFFP